MRGKKKDEEGSPRLAVAAGLPARTTASRLSARHGNRRSTGERAASGQGTPRQRTRATETAWTRVLSLRWMGAPPAAASPWPPRAQCRARRRLTGLLRGKRREKGKWGLGFNPDDFVPARKGSDRRSDRTAQDRAEMLTGQ
jgi:hypothetical protein